VLLFQPDMASTTVSDNTIVGNDIGVYNYATNADTAASTISSNYLANNRYFGVFLDQGHTALTGNTINGPSNVGIEAYSFSGSAQVSGGVLTSNLTSRNKTDVMLQSDPGAPGPAVSGHSNKFLGTGQGVVNQAAGFPT